MARHLGWRAHLFGRPVPHSLRKLFFTIFASPEAATKLAFMSRRRFSRLSQNSWKDAMFAVIAVEKHSIYRPSSVLDEQLYYEAHHVPGTLWLKRFERRRFLKGLIQPAWAAFVHLRKNFAHTLASETRARRPATRGATLSTAEKHPRSRTLPSGTPLTWQLARTLLAQELRRYALEF